MAKILPNRFIDDLDTRRIIGYSLPLNGEAVFNPTYTTKEQIKTNLTNYLLTNKKERVFNPNFGSSLRNLLFENIDNLSLDEFKVKIENEIIDYFPLVEITSLEIIPNPDINTVNFQLKYSIRSFNIEDTINILIN